MLRSRRTRLGFAAPTDCPCGFDYSCACPRVMLFPGQVPPQVIRLDQEGRRVNHGAHGPVEDEYTLFQAVFERLLTLKEIGHRRCAFFILNRAGKRGVVGPVKPDHAKPDANLPRPTQGQNPLHLLRTTRPEHLAGFDSKGPWGFIYNPNLCSTCRARDTRL
ncbi:MAG: hypothetical protein JWP63_7238 [Candidatus Solibacter sp.]|nr:hypothetical protein [Candidatus Solibacter sp.]